MLLQDIFPVGPEAPQAMESPETTPVDMPQTVWSALKLGGVPFHDAGFDPTGGEPMFTSGGMPSIGASLYGGGGYRPGFDPSTFPTSLDPLAGPSYGLPSIWQGDMTTAETNEWAEKMATNPNIPQFMQNTFSDPMALRQGKGVYNMDFDNPLNRPAEQLTPAYQAKRKAFNSAPNVARMQATADALKSIRNRGGGPSVRSVPGGRGALAKAKNAVRTTSRPGVSPGGFGWRR